MTPLVRLLAALVLLLSACAVEPDAPAPEALGTQRVAVASRERVLVTYRAGQKAGVLQAARGLGGEVYHELDSVSALAVSLPAPAVSALRAHADVAEVEPDPLRRPLAQTVPYGADLVQARDVWDANRDGVVDTGAPVGAGRKVCIIDSGYSLGHEDLQTGRITGYPAGWDTDLCGHGSHVAGIVAALHNSTGVVGALPSGVDLHIIKVFGDDCDWSYASSLVDALDRCRAAGAHVVSMSLGGPSDSTPERRAFENAYAAGVLSIAAAGNEGTPSGPDAHSYPASYASVVSVAALDGKKAVADFSQKNDQVELAAPGVGVRSTVGTAETNTLTVGSTTYPATHVELAGRTTGVSGVLVDGGLCDTVGAWSGRVVLCERGSITFFEKVKNVQAGGGVAAVIYNNVAGELAATLGEGNSSTLPAIGLTREDGRLLVTTRLGQSGTVVSQVQYPVNGYVSLDGTSMAAPYVTGVAALVWSANPALTNEQVRTALQQSAEDLGAAGRDTSYGFGLVRAKAALELLRTSSSLPLAGYEVSLPASMVAGSPTLVRITAVSALGMPVVAYAGTATLTSSDARAVLPASITFSGGVASAEVTLKDPGSQTLTVTDTATSAMTGTAQTRVAVGPAHHYVVSGLPDGVLAGEAVTFSISAYDAGDNVAVDYAGSATVTSSDSRAVLPASVTFRSGVASDVTASFRTGGAHTLRVTDSTTATLTQEAQLSVTGSVGGGIGGLGVGCGGCGAGSGVQLLAGLLTLGALGRRRRRRG